MKQTMRRGDAVAVLEIAAAMLAALGLHTLFEALKEALLYPKSVRRMVRAAVILNKDDRDDLALCTAYVKSLVKNGKISPERLIILTENDIMKISGPPEDDRRGENAEKTGGETDG